MISPNNPKSIERFFDSGSDIGDKQETILSETMLVAFIDVLGIKGKIRNEGKAGEQYVLTLMKETSDFIETYLAGKEALSKSTKVIVVSDCIILACKVGLLIEFIHLISSIQYNALCRKEGPVLLRGAVVRDSVCIDIDKHRQIIGKGYLDAFELEKDIAEHPRIIIGETVLKDINAKYIFRGQDTIPSIDFLTVMDSGMLNVKGQIENQTLVKLREEHFKFCGRGDKCLRVSKKYGWMIKYIEEWCSYGGA